MCGRRPDNSGEGELEGNVREGRLEEENGVELRRKALVDSSSPSSGQVVMLELSQSQSCSVFLEIT